MPSSGEKYNGYDRVVRSVIDGFGDDACQNGATLKL